MCKYRYTDIYNHPLTPPPLLLDGKATVVGAIELDVHDVGAKSVKGEIKFCAPLLAGQYTIRVTVIARIKYIYVY